VNFPGGWEWAIDSGPDVTITTSGGLTARTFTASLPYLSNPEDPNFNYPPGHFIPFPLALVEIHDQGNWFINLEVR
jgi:hypothetical protein